MKTAIISPSGKYYGSEQTLFNFLALTKGYDVYIKKYANGLFQKLKSSGYDHSYFSYRSLSLFYLWFSVKLLLRYNKVYVNEAGHSKYIIVLSKLFFWKLFYIHVRLTEDTIASRWKGLGSNVKLISTSGFIADLLFKQTKVDSEIISSPTRAFRDDIKWNINYEDIEVKNIGIIGRVTTSKGIKEMSIFFDYLENNQNQNFHFHFFGDIDENDNNVTLFLNQIENLNKVNITFEGFVNNKNAIFDNIDLVLHFNKEEPLGVIFLEALNQGKPFIGFNAGGIGCIARNLQLTSTMSNITDNWCKEFITTIDKLDINQFIKARELMLEIYSPEIYCKRLENLIS